MKYVSFDDGCGHRDRQHKSFVVSPLGKVLSFEGKSLPGCRVLTSLYTKNGKWSHSTWECELAEGFERLIISENWETGAWFNGQTWEAVIKELENVSEVAMSIADKPLFIRAFFPKTAERLDKEAASSPPSDSESLQAAFSELAAANMELFEAKQVLTDEIRSYEVESEAARIKERAAKLRAVSGKKLSLAELQSILKED